MEHPERLAPVRDSSPTRRQRLGLKGEFVLVLLPTLTILVVLALVERLPQQRSPRRPTTKCASCSRGRRRGPRPDRLQRAGGDPKRRSAPRWAARSRISG